MDFINVKNFFLNDGLKFFHLANSYYYGINVNQNIDIAYELYLKAALLGISEAQNILGIMLFNGEGTNKSVDDSIIFFEKAANQGNTTSMFNLAMIYLTVEDKKDYKKARNYLIQLIDLGYSLANDVLGYVYFEGIGEEKNYDKALSYWNKLSDVNNDTEDENKEQITENLSSPNFTSESLDTNSNSDLDDNHDTFRYTIGTIDNFEELTLPKNNIDNSIKLSSEEADLNTEKMELANNYFNGNNVDIDYVKAFELYKDLAESGNINAQIKIANMYKDGLGVDQDYSKSIEWYSKTLDSCN